MVSLNNRYKDQVILGYRETMSNVYFVFINRRKFKFEV